MNDKRSSRWRIAWVLPPLALGILAVVMMAGGRQPPAREQAAETRYPVRTIEVQASELVPRAQGYGEVRPAKVWVAVAQVAGRVIEVHPQLRDGEIVPAGTLLLRIDPVDYELQLAQARAELAELDVQEQNARSLLAIDQGNLRVAERERERLASLRKAGTASASDLDSAERALLSARTAVQNTENTLALLPTRRRVLEARAAQAARDLANTAIHAPFDLRVAGLAIEKDQYVGVGQALFQGDAIDRVEIVAQVPLPSLRNLFIGRRETPPSVGELPGRLAEFTGFRPLVRMDLGGRTAEWDAEFVRFSDQVDPQTRTIGVVVAVDDPLRKVVPGQRPPLSKGMFVDVLIRGHVQADRVVVPRSALRNGSLYVVDGDERLAVRPAEVLFHQGALAVIERGVAPGERLVVSDPIPAVAGMPLLAVADDETQRWLDAAIGALQ